MRWAYQLFLNYKYSTVSQCTKPRCWPLPLPPMWMPPLFSILQKFFS